ncbi:MAG: DUF1932 domain-containing protein [Pseudomonadota bacterium]
MDLDSLKIAFVGMGEAGSAIVTGWGATRAHQIAAYDIKIGQPDTSAEITQRCADLCIGCKTTVHEALHDAALIFSTVTADQAVDVAQTAAPSIKEGAYWCDLNSCAPSSKTEAADIIQMSGGRYVDVAVMSPVHPKLHRTPLLISGTWSTAIAPLLDALDMDFRIVDGPVGRASSIKMVRSIMVKGLEALTAECTLAAIAAGVADDVLPSLQNGHPKLDVEARAIYNFERSLVHGARRAAEMDEVAKMLSDLGLPGHMSEASALWQRKIAEISQDIATSEIESRLAFFADALLPGLQSTGSK